MNNNEPQGIPDKGIETDDGIACDVYLGTLNALYEQAKKELDQHGTSDALLSFAIAMENEANQMAELLEVQRRIQRKPSYSRDMPGIPYSMLIEYSPESLCYHVTLPEFVGSTNGQYITSGKTYAEAAQKGEDTLAFLMETAKQENEDLPKPDVVISEEAAAEIDRKWDELLNSPESLAYQEKVLAELEVERAEGRLTPGFPGRGEFTDKLESAVKNLISRVMQGIMERDQELLAIRIYEALDAIIDNVGEKDPEQ